jgi:hypothetical protein
MISCSDGGENVDVGLLGCNAAWTWESPRGFATVYMGRSLRKAECNVNCETNKAINSTAHITS